MNQQMHQKELQNSSYLLLIQSFSIPINRKGIYLAREGQEFDLKCAICVKESFDLEMIYDQSFELMVSK